MAEAARLAAQPILYSVSAAVSVTDLPRFTASVSRSSRSSRRCSSHYCTNYTHSVHDRPALIASREGRRHNFDRRALSPVEAWYTFYRAPLSRLQPRHRIGVVEGESLAVFDDLPAVYKDVAHRALGRRIDEAADRVVERPHRRMLGIDDHEIRLGAGREPAEMVATERAGTADGRGGEDVGRSHGMSAFGSDSGEDSRCAHLLDQIVREG